MSPSNSKLSPNRKTTSCINNKNGKRRRKRSFRTSKSDDDDDDDVTDDFYHIRKKSIKHSQVDINNAVLTAPNGCIMTRNKLKKQLTNNSELVETTVIEDKCSKIDNIRSKSEKGKQLDTNYKKRTPSLFESDSDPEIDHFQIKDSIKNEEVEEISTCISYPDDIFYPAFDKNVDVRTYFNKKIYPIYNKSNVQSLNTFEKINEESSSSYYRVKTAHEFNQCKSISQNYSKTSKSLKVTGPTTSMQINSEGDEIIVVTESLIRQLKKEMEITKKQSQDSNISTTISEEIIDLTNIQTFKCDKSSSDQSIENHPNSEKNITCHLSLDQIEPNQYFHKVIKDEIKNKPKYYNSKGSYNCLLKNDNLSSTNDSFSNKTDLNSKCHCKNFRSFDKDVNMIFTSKIKHFAFNNNAKKIREKILREKHLEANLLNMLITKEHKNIILSNKHIPIFNSISINKKYEKFIDLKENHHIKPEDSKTNAVGKINTSTTCILKVADSSKDERTVDCLSSAASIKNFTTDIKFCEKNLINPKKKQFSEINLIKNEKVSNHILPKNNSIDDHIMSFEMCNEFNKIKSLNKSISSNPTTIENNSDTLQKPNVVKTKYSELRQSISTKGESILKSDINNRNLQKKTISHSITTQKSNSLQKSRRIIDSEKETNITLLFEPPQYKKLFDTGPMLLHISENNNNEPVINLFDLPVDDINFSLNNNSSDDDGNRKLIEDSEPNAVGKINKSSTCILKLADSSKDVRKIDCVSSAASIKNFTTNIKICEKKLTNPKNKTSSEINIINEKVSNSILPKKSSLDDCMSFEMCNEFYKIKSLNRNIVSKNESLPKHIQDILKEMYVDELFVSTCQHMVDSYNDNDQLKNVFFQTDECGKIPSDVKFVCDIINKNGPMLSHIISENNEPVNNLFDLPVDDCFLIK